MLCMILIRILLWVLGTLFYIKYILDICRLPYQPISQVPMNNFDITFYYLVQSHPVKLDRFCVLSKFEVNITHIDL